MPPLEIPPGYIQQWITPGEGSGASYIKSYILREWFTKHPEIVGSRADIKVRPS